MSKRIYQYPEVTELQEGDVMLIDKEGNETAKSILASKVAPALMNKTITERGTYKASDDGVRGYNEVNVDIPYTDIHVATGAIATFEGEDLPLKSLTASIVPVQAGSGDPSPTNVRPISGWSGVNVYDGSGNLCDVTKFTHTGVTNDSGSVNTMNSRLFSDKIFIKPNYDYTYTIVGSAGSVDPQNIYCNRIIYYDESGTFLSRYNPTTVSSATFTPPANARYFVLDLKTYSNYDIEISDITSIMVNIGSTAQTYIPYAGTTTTIPFTDGQGQSVEVFGGSVDVVNGGEQPRTLGGVDMGTLNWVKGNMNTAGTGRIFYVPLTASSPMKQPSDNGFCEALTYNPFSNWTAGQWERQILNGITVTGSFALVACVPDIYATASDFKTAMNGVQLVYELATPTTFYTQPTSIKSNEGVNNVFASTGDVDVEYQTVWVRPTE